VNSGLGGIFGDGRVAPADRSIAYTKMNVFGSSVYPGPGDLSVSVRGLFLRAAACTYQEGIGTRPGSAALRRST
jgi:hypothetical protein